MKFEEVVRKYQTTASKEDMELLTDLTSSFLEKMRNKHPEAVDDFLKKIENEFDYFLDYDTAKDCVAKMYNFSRRGGKWSKEECLKAFTEFHKPLSTSKYSENGIYYAMNMVYTDYYSLYKDNLEMYVCHAYLFLNDEDYQGRYSKEKWYALHK